LLLLLLLLLSARLLLLGSLQLLLLVAFNIISNAPFCFSNRSLQSIHCIRLSDLRSPPSFLTIAAT
jgi:hypothetical protein